MAGASVQVTDDVPSASDVVAVDESDPPPTVAHVKSIPRTAAPLPSITLTTSAESSGEETFPAWPDPDTTMMLRGVWAPGKVSEHAASAVAATSVAIHVTKTRAAELRPE